jgi:hypothetical protein
VQLLKAHKAHQDEERVAGDDWHESGMVFTPMIGTPLSPESLIDH